MNTKDSKIYPLAYKLASGQTCTLHYLGFPKAWKMSLLDIASKNNPYFKREEYGLPTNTLKKLVESWMLGIIALAPLKQSSCDEHWLTSCYEYSKKDVKALCDMIKVWVKATYIIPAKTSPIVKKLANDFCDSIEAEELAALQSKGEVCLTLEDGTVCEEAYQAIPFLAINRLLGQEISLEGQPMRLCYAAKNQLISSPITDSKSNHQYSFVFDLSVQTTPPQRKALLLCQMSIRRWIPDRPKKERSLFLPEGIIAHIKISDHKYCQVPISYDLSAKKINWREQDKECYNIWGYEQLPLAEDVLMNPAAYTSQILLPYKNGMRGFTASKIGTGVSALDKAALYQSISTLLDDMVCERPEAERVSKRGQKFATFKSPQEYASCEDFRSWVHKCVETDQIIFEFYGLWKDPAQQEILNQIQRKVEQDFGEDSETSDLRIQCVRKEIGDLADSMPNDKKETKIRRCEEIVAKLGRVDSVYACIFLLPGKEHYTQGDPKQVLRNAFARTGRVVQFINPERDINQSVIDHAVYDLYRQLGIVTLLNPQKKVPPLAATSCVGMYSFTQIHGIGKRARFLPVYITVNVKEGKTRVHCDAFSKGTVSYREACLETAQLFWKNDLEQRCVDASRSPAKQKLIELKNHNYREEDSVLLVVQADGNTRALWGGISDKAIGQYTMTDEYCPTQIDAGMPNNPYLIDLIGSGIRIIRIRSNNEIPDYYTELSKRSTDSHLQYSSASGVFRYENVYWGVHERPKDTRYTNSFKRSRIDCPKQDFAEKDMIELYPLQLQPGDDAADWIFYINALRRIPIQYDQSTVLPLPLHLAKALEEYLFNA